MKLEGKRVLVFGAGISGIGAADLLCKVGACPVIYDGNDKQDPEAIRAKLEQPEKVEIILGELSEEARKTLNLVVMSPGVPTDLPIYNIAGDQDPVGMYGEGVYQVSNWLAETGHEDVTTELYTGFRHEIHNYTEIKDDVADGIIEFMDESRCDKLLQRHLGKSVDIQRIPAHKQVKALDLFRLTIVFYDQQVNANWFLAQIVLR